MPPGPSLDFGISPGHSLAASYRFEYASDGATGHRVDIGYRARF